EWPRWYVGGRMNYVESCVDRHARGALADEPAIIWIGDDGDERWLRYRELQHRVSQLAAGLQSLGVQPGDRVALFMPLVPETAIALFACGKIGAIAIPTFSGYGAEAVATRLQDSQAKVLIVADGFPRRGRIVSMKETADAAVKLSPSVEHVVVFRRTGREIPWAEGRDVWWDELTSGRPVELEAYDTGVDDPCMIIYTSGTTGRPKGALHSHAGFPVKAAQDMAHCFDVHQGDRLFWLTDIGWMMGPWAVMGATMLGATVVLFEGTPDFPDPSRLWEIVERHRVTHLGIAPTVIRALMSRGDDWVERHDLSSLLVLGGSGEPWNLGPWLWYFEKAGKSRLPIINYSGGTETSGGILGCNTILPLRPMAFSTAVPGMDAAVFDEAGRSVRDAVGELVVRRPWVGMTHGFWHDDERYLETYWSRWPGVWAHGDWAVHETGDDESWFILGRSDDTLKIAGKRLGPAEVETAACAHPAVAEAAAIGLPDEVKGEVVAVFAVLRQGHEGHEELRREVRQLVGEHLGKALMPDRVLFVDSLPKTRNAKVMRRVIRARYLGQEMGDLSSLENPAAVEEIARAR
ncbi:MAG TPA: AMP-binding protein, partial [Chloroflexota bacterium]|nr:AMP-binding protein [Chloroflexota bacterium]